MESGMPDFEERPNTQNARTGAGAPLVLPPTTSLSRGRVDPPAAGPSNTKWWLLTVAVVVAAVWFMRTSDGKEKAPFSAVKSVIHLDTFVLNLAGTDERSYLRVGIDVGVSEEAGTNGAKGAPPVALLRDTIISVLSKSDADALLKADGKDKLKVELVKVLRERAPDLGVQEVYFTEFLVQR